MKNKTTDRGFSLLEMLIYISILVLLLAIIMNIVIAVIRSDRIIGALRDIENSAVLSLESVSRETRRAESVDLGSSIFDSSPGRLVLDGADDLGNPRRVEFYLASGALMLAENGAELGALTQTGARVSSLVFRRFAGPNAEGVRTEITIESGTSTHYRSNNFYFSAVIR